jgi:hypothetical protein
MSERSTGQSREGDRGRSTHPRVRRGRRRRCNGGPDPDIPTNTVVVLRDGVGDEKLMSAMSCTAIYPGPRAPPATSAAATHSNQLVKDSGEERGKIPRHTHRFLLFFLALAVGFTIGSQWRHC